MISGLSETAGERTDNPVLGKAAGMDMGVLDEGTGGTRPPVENFGRHLPTNFLLCYYFIQIAIKIISQDVKN